MKQTLLNLVDTRLKKVVAHLFIYSLIGSVVYLLIMPKYSPGSIGVGMSWIASASAAICGVFLLAFLLISSFIKRRNFFIKTVLIISLIISGVLGLFSVYMMGLFADHPTLPYKWLNLLYSYLPSFFITGSAFLWLLTPKTKIVLILRRLIFTFVFFYLILSIPRLVYYIGSGSGRTPDIFILGIVPFWGWLILTGLLILTPILNTFFIHGQKKITFFVLIVFCLCAILAIWKINPYTCSNKSFQTVKEMDRHISYSIISLSRDTSYLPYFFKPEYYNDDKTIIGLTDSSEKKLKTILKVKGSVVLSEKLKGLDCLEKLNLENVGISEVKNFPNLINLRDLDLSRNPNLSDISFLSRLEKLERLNLSNTSVSDISVLSSLTNLEEVSLNNTPVSDISALSNLDKLKVLSLAGVQVSDISALSSLSNIEDVSLRETNVSDISALSSLEELNRLTLSDAPVSDVSPLSGLSNLEKIYLNSTLVSDISPLASLFNLKVVRIGGTNVPKKECERVTPEGVQCF